MCCRIGLAALHRIKGASHGAVGVTWACVAVDVQELQTRHISRPLVSCISMRPETMAAQYLVRIRVIAYGYGAGEKQRISLWA